MSSSCCNVSCKEHPAQYLGEDDGVGWSGASEQTRSPSSWPCGFRPFPNQKHLHVTPVQLSTWELSIACRTAHYRALCHQVTLSGKEKLDRSPRPLLLRLMSQRLCGHQGSQRLKGKPSLPLWPTKSLGLSRSALSSLMIVPPIWQRATRHPLLWRSFSSYSRMFWG